MGTKKTAPNDWMINDGTGKTEVYGSARGWMVVRPDGTEELLHCMADVLETIANAAGIMVVRNPLVGSYALGEFIEFKVTWDEPVNIVVSGGIPRIPIKVGKRAVLSPVIGTGADLGKLMSVTVTDGGSGYAEHDVVTVTDVGTQATGTISFTDDTVANVAMVVNGTGYNGTEAIVFDAPTKTNSTATVTVAQTGGIIDTAVFASGGYGYVNGATVGIVGGNNDATVTLTVVAGAVTAVVLVNPGTGYTSGVKNLAAPTRTVTTAVATPVFSSVLGSITGFTFSTHGYGYAGTESFTLAPPVNGASATARVDTIGPGGVITAIEVTAPGTNYRPAIVTATVADTATTKYASLIGGAKTGTTKSTFRFVADSTKGEINTVTTTIGLNSGTIISSDDGVTAATLTFPTDYVQAAGAFVI